MTRIITSCNRTPFTPRESFNRSASPYALNIPYVPQVPFTPCIPQQVPFTLCVIQQVLSTLRAASTCPLSSQALPQQVPHHPMCPLNRSPHSMHSSTNPPSHVLPQQCPCHPVRFITKVFATIAQPQWATCHLPQIHLNILLTPCLCMALKPLDSTTPLPPLHVHSCGQGHLATYH